jgi:cytochrome c553
MNRTGGLVSTTIAGLFLSAAAGEPMRPVVERLAVDDMIAVAAYAAAQEP